MGDTARYEAALSEGHSYSWEQKWEEAIQAFQLALDEFPQEPAPYAGLGMAYFSLHQEEQALQNYKLAAHYSRGEVIYLRQVAEMQERLGYDHEASQTYMAMGEIHLRRNESSEAVKNWEQAARLEPLLLGPRQRLAKYYTDNRQFPPAIQEYLAIAHILQAEGDPRKAYQIVKFALRLDPRNKELLTALDLVQHGQPIPLPAGASKTSPTGRMNGDERHPGGSSKSAKRESFGTAGLVVDAQRRAQGEMAGLVFTDVPGDAEFTEVSGRNELTKVGRDALISEGLDLQTKGRVRDAIQAYEQAVAGGVDHVAVTFNLGLLYHDQQRYDEAIPALSLAIQKPAYSLAGHFVLGQCYRALTMAEETVRHFALVLQLVDRDTVSPGQSGRLDELYDQLVHNLLTFSDADQAFAFADAVVAFLSQPDWTSKVQEARQQLNTLSGNRVMIIGNALIAGSGKVLESLHLTREYEQEGSLNSAAEEVLLAISASPDYLPAHIRLAELLAKQDLVGAAVNKYVVIGDTYRMRGDTNGAINMYEKVVEISPLDFSIRQQLVKMLLENGQIDQALHHYLALGEAYYQFAQVDQARETYQEALNLAARGTAEANWRAQFLRRIADIDMQRFAWPPALTAYRELRQNDPLDEQVALTLIDLYFKVSQPNMALRELDLYLKQLIETGRGKRVPGVLQDMVRRYPTSVGLVQRLVRLHLAQNQQQEAIATLDSLGEAQLEIGQHEEARATIEYIISLNPPNVSSYRQLLRQLEQ